MIKFWILTSQVKRKIFVDAQSLLDDKMEVYSFSRDESNHYDSRTLQEHLVKEEYPLSLCGSSFLFFPANTPFECEQWNGRTYTSFVVGGSGFQNQGSAYLDTRPAVEKLKQNFEEIASNFLAAYPQFVEEWKKRDRSDSVFRSYFDSWDIFSLLLFQFQEQVQSNPFFQKSCLILSDGNRFFVSPSPHFPQEIQCQIQKPDPHLKKYLTIYPDTLSDPVCLSCSPAESTGLTHYYTNGKKYATHDGSLMDTLLQEFVKIMDKIALKGWIPALFLPVAKENKAYALYRDNDYRDLLPSFQTLETNWENLLDPLYSLKRFFEKEEWDEKNILTQYFDHLFPDIQDYVIPSFPEEKPSHVSFRSYNKTDVEKYVQYLSIKVKQFFYYNKKKPALLPKYYPYSSSPIQIIYSSPLPNLIQKIYEYVQLKQYICYRLLDQRSEADARLAQLDPEAKEVFRKRVLEKIIDYQKSKKSVHKLKTSYPILQAIQGYSTPIRKLLKRLLRCAKVVDLFKNQPELNVNTFLIVGEMGTEHEPVAAALAYELSNQSKNELLSLHCACMDQSMAMYHLFGYRRGEIAGLGAELGLIATAANENRTLFLNEIQELHPMVQNQLLDVIRHNEIMRIGLTKPTKIAVNFILGTSLPVEKLTQFNTESNESKIIPALLSWMGLHSMIKIPSLRERQFDSIELLDSYVERVRIDGKRGRIRMNPYLLALVGSQPFKCRNLDAIKDIVRYIFQNENQEFESLKDLPSSLLKKNMCPTVLMLYYANGFKTSRIKKFNFFDKKKISSCDEDDGSKPGPKKVLDDEKMLRLDAYQDMNAREGKPKYKKAHDEYLRRMKELQLDRNHEPCEYMTFRKWIVENIDDNHVKEYLATRKKKQQS